MVGDEAFRLAAEVQRRVKVAITGGAAVQLLTRGQFMTMDVDLVLVDGEREEIVEKTLWKLGFIRRGAYWLDKTGENLFQIVGPYFDRLDWARYKNLRLRISCLEYLIAFRLFKCSRGETRMCEQALYMLEEYKKDLDMPYLRELLGRFKVDESFLSKVKLKRLSVRKRER
ncbi:MAG: hypothetical protein QMD95_04370 [Candidatus Hodarchaeaceae archaeon]|nr:hypothetical protein [Candidatus Hodarchaeaceae archaeon]